jgi:hypothetical protein
MKFSLAALLILTPLAGAAAQTADFRCPAAGTEFTYRSGGGDSVRTASGQDGNACLMKSTSGGKTEDVRVHWGLIGAVDSAGETYVRGIDLKSLWPLRVGHATEQVVNGIGHGGQPYTSKVTMKVVAFEKVTVPFGTVDTFRVEETKDDGAAPHIHWWAPTLGISAKESFPDWKDRSKTIVYELASVKAPAK